MRQQLIGRDIHAEAYFFTGPGHPAQNILARLTLHKLSKGNDVTARFCDFDAFGRADRPIFRVALPRQRLDADQAAIRYAANWLVAQADWDVVTDNDDLLQAVVTTPTMRFQDDVQMRFDGAAGVIQVRSSSRLGIGDMGANRERVERLRALVADTSP